MKKFLVFLVSVVIVLSSFGVGISAPIVYTSEMDYLNALSFVADSIVTEGFEGADWASTRPVPAGVPSLTTQGIQWTAGNLLTTVDEGSAWVRSGSYGVFDQDGVGTDSISVSSATADLLIGVGGWFNRLDPGSLDLLVNDLLIDTLAIDSDTSSHQFFGVIDPLGLVTVQYAGLNHWGADDFSFGLAAPVPEPSTLILIGTGLIGLVGFRRKFRV